MSTTTNLPKLPDILPLKLVEQLIDAELAPLRERADALTASCKRFIAAHPAITSSADDALAAEVLAVVQRFTSASGRVEQARVALKAPILAADNAIGSLKKGPFARLAESVDVAATAIRKASLAYKVKVEAETRAAAQEEAKKRAAEAALAEKLAARQNSTVTYEDAATAHQAAEAAQMIADARPAELTRSHGDGIGTTSIRYRRIVTIVEPHNVPRQFCVPDLALLTRAAGKAGDPLPAIAGVSISDVPDLTVRR
jgi:hypothetical protein